MRTQVGIIGAGPSGLLLSQLLHLEGIDSVVLERRSREHVLGRVRAGVLEPGTVEVLRRARVAARLDAEGLQHSGVRLAFDGRVERIDLEAHTGRHLTVYGQTEITHDLVEAREAAGAMLCYEAEDVAIEGADGASPVLRFRWRGEPRTLACDFVAGCDGFHGVSRDRSPAAALRTFERVYPFGWLGILADTRPVSDELIYSSDEHGFALCSLRSPTRSRCYVQCAPDEDPRATSDERFWQLLRERLPSDLGARLETGPSLEKSVAPLRSFVAEPMRYGRLFLAGDAAHIVPPTGAKGLNLAVADVQRLADALIDHYRNGTTAGLDAYSDGCLRRVWRAERFSAWLTALLHRHPERTPFDRRLQLAELDYLASSPAAQAAFAENYVGLPL